MCYNYPNNQVNLTLLQPRYVGISFENLMYLYLFQGANISQLERDIGSEQFPPNEHYFGLVNVSYGFFPPIVFSIEPA